MEDQKNISRRQAAGSIAAGLVAAVALPVDAQSNKATPVADPLRNPVDKYQKPPFPAQAQPWPGLASKMQPRPDHGETSYKGSGRLTGRKALITGGDSGIGRAAAIAFAREGADVAINYLPAEESDAREVVQLIKDAGRKAVAVPGDIRTEAVCQQIVADAVRGLGGLDILVNNAARQLAHESINDLSTDHFDWTFKTNVYATFWISKAALPNMQPGSSIINTVSVNSYEPREDLLDYAMTKGALLIFTKGLAKQQAKKGIRVNGVAPGPVWTPLQVVCEQKEEKLVNFGGDTPMGRPGQPAELGSIYVQLAANDASFSTGQIYGASGGNGNP